MMLLCFTAVRRNKHSGGFTLIELMITIVLIAIMVNLVIPLSLVLEDFKLNYLSQRLYSSALLARSEAIKRGVPVSVCRSANGTVCHPGTDWSVGWMIFVNPNRSGGVDPGEEIIQVYNRVNSPMKITWSDGQLLTFLSRGSPPVPGTYTLCPVRGESVAKREVHISGSGSVRERERGTCP